MVDHPRLLTIGDVARQLGVSVDRVRQLDEQLEPHRDSSGRRLYALGAVERVAGARAVRRAQREGRR